MPLPQEDRKYTYADYLTWPEDERWEIIDGIAYMMTAPTWQHQAISRELNRQISNYLFDKPCKSFAAPFDLRIPEFNERDEETTTIVQPDLVVICNKEGLKGTGFYGIPTIIIEILSPSTARKDKILKFSRYQRAGIQEYWMVSPEYEQIEVYTLQENKRYELSKIYTIEDKLITSLFPDLEIDLKPVFTF